MNPGPGFEQVDGSIIGGAKPGAKVIAYYLPQFHQIPENDQWKGRLLYQSQSNGDVDTSKCGSV